ncbi:YheC/YheD family protein [Bacillus sp. sid0103]|uniref:YheC/YheD family protein n=1 Tax=Bacillus sp. sid0103 TaxID=2856337 RepID=UPI001C43D218|nr:YheC/YheD family protein [Bacillus sp. sid0103]MBV7508017.1 YheC/YheD family protein [Bacillus sp. sid0103]
MEPQYIGILLSVQLYRELTHGKNPQILSFYDEAGKINDIIPIYLRLENLQPGVQQTIGYVMDSDGKYRHTIIPKPWVIHNRGYQSSKAAKIQIKRLQDEGIIIFNDWNHHGKFKIHKILAESEELKPHLPKTVQFNQNNMIDMMEKHSELMVKPSSGTFGKRNMKATRLNDGEWLLSYPYNDSYLEKIYPAKQLPLKINSLVNRGLYIIQERIALAEYYKNPFDLRVSVQRNGEGEWQVTGMVGKVAKTGSFVTNVARGGTCFALDEILSNFPRLNEKQVVDDVKRLALRVAQHLENHMNNLADMGLDIGITGEGFPMFIECNARDLRFAFREALLLDTWKETYLTPIRYGKYLLTSRNS